MPIWKAVISGTFYGQLWQNRIYVKNIDDKTEELVAFAVRDFWVQKIRATQIADVFYTNIQVTRVSQLQPLAFTLATPLQGAQAPNTGLMPYSCWVVQLRTGLAGKKFRGRVYVPVPMPGHTFLGQITAAGLAFWNQTLLDLNAFWVDQTIEGYKLVIHGELEAHDTEVTHIQLRPSTGVQRRRNIGVGA
jgi:hypothetical protein